MDGLVVSDEIQHPFDKRVSAQVIQFAQGDLAAQVRLAICVAPRAAERALTSDLNGQHGDATDQDSPPSGKQVARSQTRIGCGRNHDSLMQVSGLEVPFYYLFDLRRNGPLWADSRCLAPARSEYSATWRRLGLSAPRVLRCSAMNGDHHAMLSTSPPETGEALKAAKREGGLHKRLSSRQVAMIGLGCTIGTGLFLGSAISVKLAGPAVIVSFAAGALIALSVMWALAEMAVEQPAAGSFGLYAEMYLHPWAGFAVRYTYWLCLVMIVGSEVVAAAIYCGFWFPHAPAWIWIAGFSMALVLVNTLSIEDFGSIEYWLAMIKVVTIVVFLTLGSMLLFGVAFPRVGLGNFTAHGGFSPNGLRGVGLGVVMAIFSYLGLEIVGVTAGEAADPKTAVPRALRRTLGCLALFYLGGLA